MFSASRLDPRVSPPNLRRAVLLALLSLHGVCITACGSKDSISTTPVSVGVEISHVFGAKPFALHSDYTGDAGQALRVTRLNYYLGQFRLHHENGRWFSTQSDPASPGDYRLIDAAHTETQTFAALQVPPGSYKALEFLLGVDAARNSGGAQTGALDPAAGMFWTWKSGYIFFALEGRSPASGASNHELTYHVGGDAGLARTLLLPLDAEPLTVEAESQPVIHLQADLGRFFRGLPLESLHTVMMPKGADVLADGYAGMFKVDHVHRTADPS